MNLHLQDKSVLITGGSKGIGLRTAMEFAREGCKVAIVARGSEDLQQAAAQIGATGATVATIQADVSRAEDAAHIVDSCVEQLGGLDILINNVGGRRIDIPTADMPLEEWKRILDLNLNSTFLCTKLIGGAMVARGSGGRVINIASISGMVVNRDIGGRSYETSKAAVIHFTRATAADWAPSQVTVNAICPGGFMTEPNVKWAAENPAIITTFRDQIPAGDFGQPEDMGPLAVYLASDASRYITGASIVIDGGYTLW